MKTLWHWVLAAGILTLGAGLHAAATTQPASAPARPANDRVKALANFVQTIHQSDTASEVLSAYAKGCAIDRNSIELNDAYMRRMLKFGMPQIAFLPARILTNIQPENGMAWGVVGYMHGRHDELAEAFVATVRAAQYLGDDPSILNNLGQLVAWYEAKVPKVPDSARRILADIRDKLDRKEPFVKAYVTLREALRDQASTEQQFEGRIGVAESAAAAARRDVQDLESAMKEVGDRMDYQQREIDRLWRELRYTYLYPPVVEVNGVPVYSTSNIYRQDLRTRIRDAEQGMDALKLQAADIRRKGELATQEFNRRLATLDKLRKESLKAMTRLDRTFRWDPPTIEGKVVPETDRFPAATRPFVDPNDPETRAAQQLALAGLYLRNGMEDRAIDILQKIIAQLGSTKAAAEAKEMLTTVKQEK